MWVRVKTVVLALAVAAAALVPLFGDPRQTPVTHALWARMLLRSLEMTEAVRASGQASQVFATLAWRDSLAYPAERYLSARGAAGGASAGGGLFAATAIPAEVTYALAVVQPGDYRLRARLSGSATPPCTAEIVPLAGGAAISSFTLVPGAEPGWVLAGSAHLDPGAYGAQFLLPPGATLSRVEIAPPCVNAIEPNGGWKADAIATTQDVALTALKAMDAEHELPPAATPLEIPGEAFQVESPAEALRARATAGRFDTGTLRAGRQGLRAVAVIELPEPGLYSLSALVSPGAGQRWLVDGCRKAVVCPADTPGAWRPILSQAFSAGRHTLTLTLGEGASVDRIRLELKKDAAARYVETLRRLGFEAGADGPVERASALDAARFVRDKRRATLAALCGDHLPFEETEPTLPAQLLEPEPERPGSEPPPPGGGEPPPVQPPSEPPLGPPILPPQPPATPTVPAR